MFIVFNTLEQCIFNSSTFTLAMQVFLVISDDKTMPIKRDTDQCCFLDYAAYSFTTFDAVFYMLLHTTNIDRHNRKGCKTHLYFTFQENH